MSNKPEMKALEPAAMAFDDAVRASIAISLKRIADVLEAGRLDETGVAIAHIKDMGAATLEEASNLLHGFAKDFVPERSGASLAQRVKELREAKGLSQARLAAEVTALGSKMSQQNVANIENGIVKKPGNIVHLAQALGVPVESL